jgi:stress-induced morphogen
MKSASGMNRLSSSAENRTLNGATQPVCANQHFKVLLFLMAKFRDVMKTEEVQNLIQEGLDGATAEVTDLQGTGDHFSARVIWSGFEGLSLIQQHQAVYKTLGTFLTNEIHALQLKTSTE